MRRRLVRLTYEEYLEQVVSRAHSCRIFMLPREHLKRNEEKLKGVSHERYIVYHERLHATYIIIVVPGNPDINIY